MTTSFSLPPSLEDLQRMADAALEEVPPVLLRQTRGLVIRVAEFPEPEIEREMKLASPFDLLGLYQGLSIDLKSVNDVPQDVDMVFLYRRPILDYWCETGEDLVHLVRHVLIHEIGHHFGFSDDDMDRIESGG